MDQSKWQSTMSWPCACCCDWHIPW